MIKTPFATILLCVLATTILGCSRPPDTTEATTADASISNSTASPRPNILLLLIDDQNDLVSALGHPDSQTPNLDRLAQRSTLFTRAYCTAPACGPSRASFLTGILPSTSGVYYNSQPDQSDPREWMRNLVNLPQRFFDMYPLEEVQIPDGYREGDLDDLPECAKWMAHQVPGHTFGDSYLQKVIAEGNDWKAAIQAYKAAMSHMDDQLGRVLQALEESPHADNTIVVVAGDHGYHLGEKEHWTKFGLWEQTLRVPFLVALPGQTAQTADTPVGLIDLYPTLVSFAGIQQPPQTLEGIDLSPILRDASLSRGRPVLSTYGFQCHSLRDDRYRYIRYRNGDEELYDHSNDPHEFTNLAPDPTHAQTLARFRAQLPTLNTPEPDTGGNLGWDPAVFQPTYTYTP